MEMLLNDEFIPAVKDGTKTSTVRKGVRSSPDLGENVTLQGAHDSVEVHITGKSYVPYRELNTHDAIRDGFKSLDELQSVLTGIYGPFDEREYVTIFKFARL